MRGFFVHSISEGSEFLITQEKGNICASFLDYASIAIQRMSIIVSSAFLNAMQQSSMPVCKNGNSSALCFEDVLFSRGPVV